MGKKTMPSGPSRADSRIGDIAQRWFLVEPLLFSMYCTHVLSENSSMDVPLRTGGGRIEYNPELIASIDDNELADRMKVEALRIVLKHPYQRQPFRARPEILYLASNMTILDNMGGPKAFCFELVPQWIVDAMPKKKTFEEYYGLLNRLIPPMPANDEINISIGIAADGSNCDGSSRDGSNGDGSSGDGSNGDASSGQEQARQLQLWIEDASLWEEDSIMSVDINLIIQAVMAGPGKGWGGLPADFVECVKASLVPPIDVANVLKGFKKSILSQRRDLTRMRPSRRYGFEQMGSKYSYTTRVLVAIDVSGSVDSEMLSRMLGLINRIFKQGVERIDVLQFDAVLKGDPQPIRKAINTFKVLGRGGTDFQPAADYYMDHPEYDGLIYITDGIAPDPVIPAEYRRLPVTWIITDDDLIPSIRHGWKS